MSNFEPDAIIRGAQLTLVGAYRALQNPGIFKQKHYKQAAIAVGIGAVVHIVVSSLIRAIEIVFWMCSAIVDLESASWDDAFINWLYFLANHVFQVPFLVMTVMQYITPTMDEMFMESLRWVDTTYIQKHKSESPENLRAMYHGNLTLYTSRTRGNPIDSAKAFFIRYGRRMVTSLVVYILSFLPLVGRFVLPAASFYAFNKAVGPLPAIAVFGAGLALPKRVVAVFLQSYFASRSLMRELLEPYFSRIPFTKEEKRRWFRDREDVLFGFAVGFYIMLKIPLLGVLLYGIAEASTAYLITKITDPPPPPAYVHDYKEGQLAWKNKHEFLKLPLEALDLHNVQGEGSHKELKGKGYS